MTTPTAVEPRWEETDHAAYVYDDADEGRCVAFARQLLADQTWEVKLTGKGHLVHTYQRKGNAHAKLRRLVGLDGTS